MLMMRVLGGREEGEERGGEGETEGTVAFNIPGLMK